MMLRVHAKPECAAIDSDAHRSFWWAEIRRHVPSEEALVLATVSKEHLPKSGGWLGGGAGGLSSSTLGLVDGCSSIAFVPAGADGSPSSIKVAPNDSEGMPAFVNWVQSCMRISCTVRNPFDEPVDLFWSDDSMEERKLFTLAPDEKVPQNTFVGHVYVARDSKSGQVLDWWTMDGTKEVVIRDRVQALTEACQAGIVGQGAAEKIGRDGEEASVCVSADKAMFDFGYDQSMAKRYALNTVQPTVVRNFSDVGYKVLPLPPQTFSWLKEWYEANADQEQVEGNAGAVGTQHLAPWHVRHIPYNLKLRLIDELRPVLAEWSGFLPAEELSMTSIYGIRRYTRGSVLRMHVDTIVSHVVSAIVNVAQEGVEEDWPLEIKSHDGLYHYVTMKPGEMLLYESAKCLHGRPAPFKGDSYANVFLHFKPQTPGSWDYNWY